MKAIANSTQTKGAARDRSLSNRPHPLEKLDSIATIMSCQRDQEICRQSFPAEQWYFVISGVARRSVLRTDGRRQIVDLVLPGDFFGFTAGDDYDYTAEAVAKDTTLACYPRQLAEALADCDPLLARELRRITLGVISRLQTQLLTVGRTTALEKVASFILEMEIRLSQRRPDGIALPISRYDIADYLAISVETVSRALTTLANGGIIELSGTRMVKIVDRDVLEDGGRDRGVGTTPRPWRG